LSKQDKTDAITGLHNTKTYDSIMTYNHDN